MAETIFSVISNEVYDNFNAIGFYYDDHTYINVFRWLWNEYNIHPRIESFPYDTQGRCMISLTTTTGGVHKLYGNNYDDGVIQIVNYIADNIDDFIKTKNAKA